MTESTKSRVLLGAVLGLAIYVAATHLPASGVGSGLRRIFGHPFLVLALAGGLGLVTYFARRGQRRRAVLAALVTAAAIAGYGLHHVRAKYPNSLLLSTAGYVKAAKLLLGQDILLSEYAPKPSLAVANPAVLRAKHPAIDLHFHLGSLDSAVTPERLVAAMDSVGIQSVVNLDFSPERWDLYLRDFVRPYPDRFINFATLQIQRIDEANFVENQTAWLEKAIMLGARGIKVRKLLGLNYRDSTKALIPIDDQRLDFIWDLAGELGLPVLMHTADPAPFFRPIDRFNERYVELHDHPEWSFYGAGFPPWDSLLAQRERLFRKHPRTLFIGAHVGSNSDDLRYVARLLDTHPNYYVDISSRLNDLGRQPRATREFFIRYQDRILFATDGGFALDRPNWSIEKFYQTHFKFLETEAEYFDYPLAEITKQGSWKIYGVSLPDSTLAKIYAGNARKLIPSEAEVRGRLLERQAASAGPPDAACVGRGYRWARSDRERPTPLGEDSAEVVGADFAGDSVRVSNYTFRPGRYREILGNGLVRNDSRSTIELRGFRVEFLSAAGKVIGARTCRIRMGYEHCGVASTNVRLPAYVAVSADTLPVAPPGARFDTARVFWTYCATR
ncbi:MAG: amidohydrolase family protein [Gemmatimonadales bacterium]